MSQAANGPPWQETWRRLTVWSTWSVLTLRTEAEGSSDSLEVRGQGSRKYPSKICQKHDRSRTKWLSGSLHSQNKWTRSRFGNRKAQDWSESKSNGFCGLQTPPTTPLPWRRLAISSLSCLFSFLFLLWQGCLWCLERKVKRTKRKQRTTKFPRTMVRCLWEMVPRLCLASLASSGDLWPLQGLDTRAPEKGEDFEEYG